MKSLIFDDLIQRCSNAAPPAWHVTRSVRPDAKADVFHFHRPNLEISLPRRSVVTVHHDLDESEPWLDLGAFISRYRQAAAVICLNSEQKRILAAFGIGTHLIPHGIDRTILPMPAKRRHRLGHKLTIGLFSRRYDRGIKGESLLKALLPKLDPYRLRFILLGEDRWRDVEDISNHGFEVEVIERLPYRLFRDVYDSIDVLLILSQREGGPASLSEALGYGVPVATTRVGMANDLVRDRDNGIFLDPLPERAAGALMEIVAPQESLLDRLQEGAFAGAARIPSWEQIFAAHFAIYGGIGAPLA